MGKKSEKSLASPPAKNGKSSGSMITTGSVISLLTALVGLIVAIYIQNQERSNPKALESNDAASTYSRHYPENSTFKSGSSKTYDKFGYVSERIHPKPEVFLMADDAVNKAQNLVMNPEDLSPYVKFLPGPPMSQRRERAMGARFRNFYPFDLNKYWDDGTPEGVYSGFVKAHGNTATNTYTTHTFIFRNRKTDEEVARITMQDNRHLYFIGPDPDDYDTLNSKEYLDSLEEVRFMEEYHAKNGVPWLSHFPRGPPQLYMYPADFVGQKHKIVSHIGYFDSEEKQRADPVEFNITVVATEPKIFLIENLLSEFEIAHIVSLGEKVVQSSMVGSGEGGFKSNTRTSENGWLRRTQTHILDTVYYRFGDVLRLTDEQLRDDARGSAEHLQFVRYLHSQKYDAHHDFGYTGRTEQRFSTLLIYLEIPELGGGTSFPKAFDGQGIAVKPHKGDAVLFYSMLEDGNGDDMSLHSGMPVEKGRKYVCNLWSWDPTRYDG